MKLETCEPKCAWVFSNKPKQTECCHYLDVSPKEGNWLPLLNNGGGLDGEDHLLVPELRLLGPAVGGGVSGRPAGEDHQRILFMWHSSKVAGLSQGSENITDENTCTGTRCWKDYQKAPKTGIMFPSSRQECWWWSRDTCGLNWWGRRLSRDVCWPSDKRIVISPRWAHTFTHFGRSTF